MNLRLLRSHFRKISSSVTRRQKNHYAALGISSKATQADVKSAYYKLSMVYHPDKNKDSEDAAKKFRDITEAYEVLGNVKSRKLYDRGLFFGSGSLPSYDEPMDRFYRSREVKSRPPAPHGRTTVYDFDEWSRSHYGATFQRDLRFKEKERFRKARAAQVSDDIKAEKVILLVGMLFVLGAFLFVDKDYDSVGTTAVFGSADIIKSKTD